MTPARNDKRSLLAALVSSVSSFLPMFLTGALAVQISSDLSAGYGVVAVAITATLLVGGLSATFTGHLVDRIGWRRTAHAASAVTSTSLLAAAALGSSQAGFVSAIAFGGFGLALAQPATNIALLQRSSERHRGAVFGLKQAASPAASLLSGLAIPLVALTVGWRWAFAGAVLFPLAAAVTVSRTAETPRPSVASPSEARSTSTGSAPSSPPQRGNPLILLGSAAALAAISIGALSTFSAPTAVAAGHSESAAGMIIVLASLVGMVVRFGGGVLIDRRSSGASGAFFAVVTLLIIGVIGLVLLSSGAHALTIPGIVLAYGGAWSWSGLYHYGVVSVHTDAPGRATGLVESGMQLGTAAGPLAFTGVVGVVGFTGAWTVMAVTTTLAGILVIAAVAQLRRHGRLPALRSAA